MSREKGATPMKEAVRAAIMQFIAQTKYDIKEYIYLSAFRIR